MRMEPTLICGQKQNGEKGRRDEEEDEEEKKGKIKVETEEEGGGAGGGRGWREEGNDGTTSDSHWNITTQRETSIRKNGLI